jgi:hypothetical protein
MPAAHILHLGAGVGFLEDGNDLGFGKSASLRQNLLAVILPESSSSYLSTFLGEPTVSHVFLAVDQPNWGVRIWGPAQSKQ